MNPQTEVSFDLGVLAGGLSRRMTRDKANLPWGHSTMIEQVIQNCSDAKTNVLISAAADRKLPPALAGIPRHEDRFPGAGPIAGLEALRRASQRDWLVIVPCDMPFLDRDILRELVKLGQSQSGCEQVILTDDRGRYSLPQAVGPGSHPAILAAIEEGHNRLLAWAKPECSLSLDVSELPGNRGPETLDNLNDPEAYERAVVAFASKPGRDR